MERLRERRDKYLLNKYDLLRHFLSDNDYFKRKEKKVQQRRLEGTKGGIDGCSAGVKEDVEATVHQDSHPSDLVGVGGIGGGDQLAGKVETSVGVSAQSNATSVEYQVAASALASLVDAVAGANSGTSSSVVVPCFGHSQSELKVSENVSFDDELTRAVNEHVSISAGVPVVLFAQTGIADTEGEKQDSEQLREGKDDKVGDDGVNEQEEDEEEDPAIDEIPLELQVSYAMRDVPLVSQPPTLKAELHEHQVCNM